VSTGVSELPRAVRRSTGEGARSSPLLRIRAALARRWFRHATGAMAAGLVLLAAVILVRLLRDSQPAWAEWGVGFILRGEWDPVRGEFGALPFLIGTLMTSALALALALPVSLGVAIVLAEYAPRPVRALAGFLVELLAAIPSVVLGLWGVFTLAPLMQRRVIPFLAGSPLGWLPFFGEAGPGYTLFTAAVILAIMITPIIATLGRDALLAVPRDQKEAALALGATHWEAVRHVVLGHARSGLFSGAILGLGRALGETMAAAMTIGNRIGLTLDYFQPGYSMTAIIANELREAATELHVASLIAIGLLLFLLSFALNVVARLLVLRAGGGRRPR